MEIDGNCVYWKQYLIETNDKKYQRKFDRIRRQSLLHIMYANQTWSASINVIYWCDGRTPIAKLIIYNWIKRNKSFVKKHNNLFSRCNLTCASQVDYILFQFTFCVLSYCCPLFSVQPNTSWRTLRGCDANLVVSGKVPRAEVRNWFVASTQTIYSCVLWSCRSSDLRGDRNVAARCKSHTIA